LSNIGSHLDCTIFLTTRALSREHDILKTLGPGQGISDKKHISITLNMQINKKNIYGFDKQKKLKFEKKRKKFSIYLNVKRFGPHS